MWLRRAPGAELAGPHGGPAAFGVVTGARVATRTGGEDGRFAGCEGGFWGVEDELEPRCGGRHLRHTGNYFRRGLLID